MTLSVSGPPSLPPIITNSILKSPKILEKEPTSLDENRNKSGSEDKDPKRCPTPVTVTFFGQNDGKLEICKVEDENKISLNPFADYLNESNGNQFNSLSVFHPNNPFCNSETDSKDDTPESDSKESDEEVSLLHACLCSFNLCFFFLLCLCFYYIVYVYLGSYLSTCSKFLFYFFQNISFLSLFLIILHVI